MRVVKLILSKNAHRSSTDGMGTRHSFLFVSILYYAFMNDRAQYLFCYVALAYRSGSKIQAARTSHAAAT